MKMRINEGDFVHAFRNHGRQEQFSYEAKQILFEYLETFQDEEYELDVIALCCEWAEMTKSELLDAYDLETLCPALNVDWFNVLDEEEQAKILQDALAEKTIFAGRTKTSEYSQMKEPTFIYLAF